MDLVASGLAGQCVIRFAPNGDLFVADSEANTIRVYRVASGSARPVKSEVYASGLNKPFGIAFYPLGPNPEWVYVANTDGVVRFPYTSGDLKASGKPEEIVEKIPSTHHWTRIWFYQSRTLQRLLDRTFGEMGVTRQSERLMVLAVAGWLCLLPLQGRAQPAGAKSHAFRGRVVSVNPAAGTLSVANENVEGWMAPMTMVYKADNPDALKSLKAGDQITATVYDGDFTTLYNLKAAPGVALDRRRSAADFLRLSDARRSLLPR